MLYPFNITLSALGKVYPEGVNEQWNTEARAFATGAQQIETAFRARAEGGTPFEYEAAARLHEWASTAFSVASARTIGHKKSERYDSLSDAHKREAARLYKEAIERWDHVKPNTHVTLLLEEVFGKA